MKSSDGSFELDVPRDRNGNFEPEIVKKNQTTMSDEIEKKILSLYALGNSYSQIAKHIEDIYCVGFSKGAISAVTDKILPMLEALDPTIFIFKDLEVLNLSENRLTSLPPEINRLNQLHSLILSDNELSCLPEEIGDLQNLESLYLSGNKLQALPSTITTLRNLKWFSLLDNNDLTLDNDQLEWLDHLSQSGCRVFY